MESEYPEPLAAVNQATVDPYFEIDPMPRWPAMIAVLAVAGIYLALPESLSVGPRWMLGALVILLLVPSNWAHLSGQHDLNQIIGFTLSGVTTFCLVSSVGLLVSGLPYHSLSPLALLHSAASLWISNVLIFAVWYWRLDAGGPHRRDSRCGHPEGAFLFPQMALPVDDPKYDPAWNPDFVDYLFLAFNTSTALSPTDVPVLSRWAKLLMMIQSSIALTLIAVLAARAVNGL